MKNQSVIKLLYLGHDRKMGTKCNGVAQPGLGSCSSNSFFVGYDLPRNEVTSAGCESGEERPRPEEKMLSSGVKRLRKGFTPW